MYVLTCVHTYVSVTLRNVNLRSRPGRISDITCINTQWRWDDVLWWRRMGRTTQLGLCSIHIWRSHVQKWVLNIAGRLVTLTKKKNNKEVRQSTIEQGESSTAESTYWRSFISQLRRYLGSLFTLPLFCTILWAPLWPMLNEPPALRTPSAHGAWSGARHYMHAYS